MGHSLAEPENKHISASSVLYFNCCRYFMYSMFCWHIVYFIVIHVTVRCNVYLHVYLLNGNTY